MDAPPVGGPDGPTRVCGGGFPRDRPTDAKKNELKPWPNSEWCIPPKASAAFVAQMEDVLDVYQRPYDARFPQICMDETSKQFVGDTRPSLPPLPGQVSRQDYEYQPNGVCNLFLCFVPLQSWRQVQVTDRRTAVDWARFMQQLADGSYAQAERIIVVLDNLNTHGPSSFYEAFPPAEARRLAARFEFHYTPKHGSWLNMAEIQLSALSRTCLDERIPNRATLINHVAACERDRNANGATVDRRFTTSDARIKLKKLYPTISV